MTRQTTREKRESKTMTWIWVKTKGEKVDKYDEDYDEDVDG